MSQHIVMGVHAIRELLLHAPHRLVCVYIEKGRGEKREEIAALCTQKGISCRFASKEQLQQLADSTSHQSMVAEIKPRNFLHSKEFLQQLEHKETSLVLMLDQLFDPQNFGAIIRSGECFGVDGIVWSKNRGVDLTPAACKASCGASELVPLIRISNLAQTMSEFQKAGFTAIAAVSSPISENVFSFHFPKKTLLIVGSEGEGIQPLIQKKADHLLHIPMQGKIASLNVSNAAAILLALCRNYLGIEALTESGIR